MFSTFMSPHTLTFFYIDLTDGGAMSALTPNNLVMGVSRFFPYHYTPRTENIRTMVSLNPCLLVLHVNSLAIGPWLLLVETSCDTENIYFQLLEMFWKIWKSFSSSFSFNYWILVHLFFCKTWNRRKKKFSNENFFHLRKQNFKSVTKSSGKTCFV